MNLKKRAAGAIAVAMSVVVMTSVAQAAPADYKTGVASQATTTDLATNGIAGIAVSMSQYESDAYEYIGLADANVEQMNVARVTSGDAAEQDADAAEEGLTEMTVDVADADTAVQAENAASGTETDVSTETAGSEQTEITQMLAQVINGVLLPVLMVCMVLIANDKRVMGQYANGRVWTALTWFTIVVVIVLTIIMFVLQAMGL